MTRMKCNRIASLAVLGIWLVSGCSTADKREYKAYKEQQKIQRLSGDFDPAYFRNTENRHMAVFFRISGGKLQPVATPPQSRPGGMPYRSADAGNVLVIYRDSSGKELGRYAVEDPLLVRSCDFDNNKTGLLNPLPENTSIEILLPDLPTITQIEIGRIDGKRKTFKINRGSDKK